MSINFLAAFFPERAGAIPFLDLVPEATPLCPLLKLGRDFGHSGLHVKREDQTHPVYGGNKVRNLEFVLAQAIALGKRRVVTCVPKGSNFTAALSAHGRAAGLEVRLAQFVALENPQIEAHHRFSERHGARIRTYHGPGRVLRAGVFSLYEGLSPRADYVVPGASSLVGALGHANAFLETMKQVKERRAPMPDFLIVGAGTCGTTAGLLAGVHLAQAPTRIIAVRCAERVVCNRAKIIRVARAVLKRLGLPDPGSAALGLALELVESPENLGYAIPTPAAREVMDDFARAEDIELDTTYTAKVALFMKRSLRAGDFRGRTVLYWHTFSRAAMPQRGGES